MVQLFRCSCAAVIVQLLGSHGAAIRALWCSCQGPLVQLLGTHGAAVRGS